MSTNLRRVVNERGSGLVWLLLAVGVVFLVAFGIVFSIGLGPGDPAAEPPPGQENPPAAASDAVPTDSPGSGLQVRGAEREQRRVDSSQEIDPNEPESDAGAVPAAASSAPPAAQQPVPAWVLVSAGLMFLLGVAGVAASVLLARRVRQYDSRLAQLNARLVTAHRPPAEPDAYWQQKMKQLGDDLTAATDRIAELEHRIGGEKTESPETPKETATVGAPPRAALARTGAPAMSNVAVPPPGGVRIIPAMIGDDGSVQQSNTSRPMVEIHWREGEGTAELRVNPEFKFADLTSGYLEAAFEVDGGGPGSYETVSPAVIEWGPSARVGRVRDRGRVRAT